MVVVAKVLKGLEVSVTVVSFSGDTLKVRT